MSAKLLIGWRFWSLMQPLPSFAFHTHIAKNYISRLNWRWYNTNFNSEQRAEEMLLELTYIAT